MDHEAVLSFEYAEADQAQLVSAALEPEIGDIDDERSRVRLQRDETTLELNIEAADLVALRAALNTWLSLVTVAENAGNQPQ